MNYLLPTSRFIPEAVFISWGMGLPFSKELETRSSPLQLAVGLINALLTWQV